MNTSLVCASRQMNSWSNPRVFQFDMTTLAMSTAAERLTGKDVRGDLLEVLDVYHAALDMAKETRFSKDHLLGVRQQVGAQHVVVHNRPSLALHAQTEECTQQRAREQRRLPQRATRAPTG